MSMFPLLHGFVSASVGDDGTYGWYTIGLGPVAYWRLDETSGNAADSVGGNTGTYVNTPTLGVSTSLTGCGTAVTFVSSSSEYVNIPHSADFNTMTSAASIVFWLRVDAEPAVNAALVTKDPVIVGTRPWAVFLSTFNTYLELKFYASDGTDSANVGKDLTAYDMTVWRHIAVTFNAGTVKMYLDGTELTGLTVTSNSLTTLDTDSTSVRLANDNRAAQNVFADVGLDEVAVYDTVLSGTNILELYNRGSGN